MPATMTLHLIDFLAPAVAAIVAIAGMSLVPEPTRLRLNAILLAGVASAYFGGGFGLVELVYLPICLWFAYQGLNSYRHIAVGWVLHACWDTVHHFYGNPLWPWMPTSSLGCAIFDPIIAIWFFAGAPSFFRTTRVHAH
jgi:Family of unknown function (DUF6010)